MSKQTLSDTPSTADLISALERANVPTEKILMMVKTFDALHSTQHARATVRVTTGQREGELGGYLVAFSSAKATTSYGTWFSPVTDFRIHEYQHYPIYFNHALHGQPTREKIGDIRSLVEDAKGVRVTAATLDLEKPFAKQCWRDAQKGRLYWSAGANTRLLEQKPSGEVTLFGLVEGSLTPDPGGIKSLNPRHFQSQQSIIAARNAGYKQLVYARLHEAGFAADIAAALAALIPDPY